MYLSEKKTFKMYCTTFLVYSDAVKVWWDILAITSLF